jgi:hypothetical protein
MLDIFSNPDAWGANLGGSTQVAPSLTQRSIAVKVSELIVIPVKKISFNPDKVSYPTSWSYTATS